MVINVIRKHKTQRGDNRKFTSPFASYLVQGIGKTLKTQISLALLGKVFNKSRMSHSLGCLYQVQKKTTWSKHTISLIPQEQISRIYLNQPSRRGNL